MPEPLLRHVQGIIERHQLLNREDRVVVGVSGGMDSMVLLHVLHALRKTFSLDLVVAHVNHGLRPSESEKEAELVKDESRRLGVPFEYGQFDVKGFQQTSGYSLQDAARRIRFRFFHQVMAKHGAHKLALGHNADDQVETILLRLFRGSGTKGLKGMVPIRGGRVIRPLLEVWRGEIESFAKEKGIFYLEDSSNLKEDYLRNRLRLKLIPLIEKEYQPNFKEVILRNSAILRIEDSYLDQKAEETYEAMIREGKDGLSFSASAFQSLPEAIRWRVLEKVLDQVQDQGTGLDEGEWLDPLPIYQRLHSKAASFLMALPRGSIVEKRYDRVFIGRGKVNSILPFEVELLTPGQTVIQEIKKEVVIDEISWKAGREIPVSPHVAVVDFHTLQFPLRMRNFRPGDRFYPIGSRGSQKLKEFFIDHKIPSFERAKIPLLISGKMVAWVAGYRVSEKVKVTEKTIKALRIEIRDVPQ